MLEADFVVVGSGSAGSALAYRLSEDGRHSVIVVEYGGSDAGPLIQMPAALSIPMNMGLYDWGFETEPEPNLGGRVLATPRGKDAALQYLKSFIEDAKASGFVASALERSGQRDATVAP